MPLEFYRRLTFLVTLGITIAIGVLVFMASVILERVAGLLAMIVLAILLAYIVAPAAAIFEKRGFPRIFSVLTIYLIGFLLIAGLIVYVVPSLAIQATDLVQNPPVMATSIEQRLTTASHDPLLSRLPHGIRETVAKNIGGLEILAGKTAGELSLHLIDGFRSGAEGLIRTILVLLLTFFLVTDAERIASTFLRIIPKDRRKNTMDWIVDVDRVIGGFVRGQLILASITSIVTIILFMVLGIKYALILGIFTGIASLIPFAGPIIGAIPAVIVSATTMGPIITAILIVGLIILFEVQGNVLTPIIIGRAVKVTPMVVFVAILAGAEVYGLLGTLLAIPIAGILRVALDRIFPVDVEIDEMVRTTLSPKKISKENGIKNISNKESPIELLDNVSQK